MALPTGGYLYEVARRALAAREERKKAENEAALQRRQEEYDRHFDSFDDEGNTVADKYGEIKRPASEITKYENLYRGSLLPGARMYAENPDLKPPLEIWRICPHLPPHVSSFYNILRCVGPG